MHRGSSLVAATLLLLTTAGPASGAPALPRERALDSGLLSPLSIAVAEDGTVWYSENYAGLLHRRGRDGRTTTPARAPGDLELSAVGERDGTVWYAVTGAGHTIGRLHRLSPDGSDVVEADLYAHERSENPDRGYRYGFDRLPPGCRAQVAGADRAAYRGKAETHPVASLPAHGAVYVADAAANAVLAVVDGTVTTVVALPPVRTTMTSAYAEENGFPACTVGRAYWAEAVPTDVEAGPLGRLYVTSLPGGPGELDGRPAGRILEVLPLTGQVRVLADGLDQPVGLAVAASGDVYVSELQGDRISLVRAGTRTPESYVEVTYPGDVEHAPDGLVATTDVLSGTNGIDPPEGELVKLN
ncbi:ScyD/ScyE family protein [Nocardioides anomalus]|uniref:ScyD/ScyE family protein n=1 Tax=Nocardioides anomalus TaxID=2712223 RepID=A0A6G6WGB0_9ACTN|nr:ScyD/ScyE family protein [Nocardioides anomalus]QIG44125.1 ScyD/ScyE family protein [Nocardioides anomalus]